jgi:hypothetical protein
MPIQLRQFLRSRRDSLGYNIAKELARQTVATYGPIRGLNAGIGEESCCAAVAVNPNNWGNGLSVVGFAANSDDQPLSGNPLDYGVACGNSQLARRRLVWGRVQDRRLGGHAERCALTAPEGLTLYDIGGNNSVLYVNLEPCPNCYLWLEGHVASRGSAANPYNNIINLNGETTLHVWYTWDYDANGIALMNGFHGLRNVRQLEIINSW